MTLITRLLFLLLILALFSPTQVNSAGLLWTNATEYAVLASPAIARDGTVYLASYDRYVYALHSDGTIKWSTNLPPPIYIYFATYTAVYGTPAIGDDGTIYVPSENGKLLALNPTNGAVKWTYSTTAVEGLYSSAAVGPEGTIYFGSYDKNLYAINPNGTLKWATPFGSTIFASPVVARDGTVYCGDDGGKLYALNPANGATNWIFDTGPYSIAAAPAIGTNGSLYLGVNSSSNPRFYSISTNGTTNWIFTTGSRVRSSAAIGSDGTIYFGCDDSKLYALNPDGTKKWDFTAGGTVGSSPAIAADGTILFGCDDGKLYAVDGNGSELWSFQTGDYVFASPAIGPDGSIYFASADGVLYVVRGCSPPMLAEWPMFRRDLERTGRMADAGTNLPPVLTPIGDWTVSPGAPLVITNLASDPNGPSQQLHFALGIGAPATATINPTNGIFTWTPTEADLPSTNEIRVTVVDDGSPPLTDVKCFTVTVVRPHIESINLSGATVTIIWQAVPSRTYRLQYKTNLTDPAWLDLPGDVTAGSLTATNTDLLHLEAQTRFYRVALLP